ncbi:TonB-dependent receptor domain-containing protein [Polaromonas eurypsychrophila]|uniref:Outer membrane protein n=1 Tax=Polaromonas eurypsychrophila TaxID=1614635 RepID=A0A916WIY3_9BURK|nr:TonB-dependent receptor [Polaromonas eurypsychrophila]GGB01709.1 outer membrane protein [Polaromonas eurypsychrophila]
MKTCVFYARPAALSLALAAAFPAFSQSPAASQLSETVVTASRVATPVTDVIADVSIIDREILERAGQSSLRDILAQQPGIQMGSNGSYRSNSSIFLRGASNSQTIVLIDGVRVGSATSGGASFENLPLARIERIEILRGAASALYGPDAVGGVIQIFTREPAEGLALSASVGFGSAGQRQADALVRGSAGAIGYSLGVSREKARGISSVSNPTSTSFNPDADGFTSTSVDAKLTAKINREHALTLSFLHSDTEYQFDGLPSPNPLGLTKLTSDARAKPKLNNATVRWDAQWLPQWKSTLTAGTSDEDSVSEYYRISDGRFGGSSRFNTGRKQLTWQNDITLDKDVLSLMLEDRSEAVDSSTSYTIKQRNVRSALASYALNRERWNALAVIRNDKNSQFGSFNNWALSAGYRLIDGLRAVASVGTSFQAPTFNQLYFPGFGNPALVPQRNRATELGLKYQQGNVALGAVAYHNDIQGFIIPSTNVQSSLAVLRGVTLSADVKSGATSYSLSYDYADPRSYSSVPASNDLRLVRIAQNVLNARVTHRMGDVSVFGELKLSSNREDAKVVGVGRDTLPGYGVLNTGVSWKVQKDVTLLARINNLTDTQYMLANGFSVPGRNLFASVTWAM